jgi:NOL1/NOP2/sun family putative RNA methylase
MLPLLLQSRLREVLGQDYLSVMSAFASERRGSFRVNTLKWDSSEVERELTEKGIIVEPFPEIPAAYTFSREYEYALKGTRAFYEGKIYLQSLASMLPVYALSPKEYEEVLDVCAAPGSKTTQMAVCMKNTGNITAIEQNQIRYDKLLYNIHLQWVINVEWVKIDAKKYLEKNVKMYDKILLDAPCSAEGRILLENEKSYGFWSLENIERKAELQYSLLTNVWKHLRKGGILIYSTCTLAPEENEALIMRFTSDYSDAVIQDIELWLSYKPWWRQGISGFSGNTYSEEIKKAVRILPSNETEGFFLVKIQKQS